MEKQQAIVSISYDGDSQKSYDGTILTVGTDVIRFMSGNPSVDWLDMYQYAWSRNLAVEEDKSVMYFDFSGNDWLVTDIDNIPYMIPHLFACNENITTLVQLKKYYDTKKAEMSNNKFLKFM